LNMRQVPEISALWWMPIAAVGALLRDDQGH
jgi:hypothetical protein